MKKILALLLPVMVLLTSCDLFNNYGKKVEVGKNEVYYKGDGVTETDAKNLGEFLKTQEYFTDSSANSVQVTKDDKGYLVRLVVNKEKLNDNRKSLMNVYWLMQALISDNVFNGAKTKIVLADTKMKDIEQVEKLTKIVDGNFHLYLKGDGVTETQARKVASLIEEQKYFGDAKEAVAFEKKDGVYVMNFVYNQDYYQQNRDKLLPVFKMIQWLAKEEAFNNANTEVNLADSYFTSYEQVGEFTQEQKDYLIQVGQQSSGQSSEAQY